MNTDKSRQIRKTARRAMVFVWIAGGIWAEPRGLPRYFEASGGQAGDADFVSRGNDYTIALRANEADFELARNIGFRMKILGANSSARGVGKRPASGRANYLIGNAPGLWRTGIPQFERVEYTEIYPGIDVAYYGNRGRLEYDFILGPRADVRRIQLEFDGAGGVRVDGGTGDLVVTAGKAEFRQKKPTVYQDTPGGGNGLRAGMLRWTATGWDSSWPSTTGAGRWRSIRR